MAKIIVICSFADSLINFRGELLRSMIRNGHTVTACAPETDFELKDTIKNWGISYQSILMKRTGLNPLNDMFTLVNIVNIFKHHDFTLRMCLTNEETISGALLRSMSVAIRKEV